MALTVYMTQNRHVTTGILKVFQLEFWPQHHKTIEYSQENSQLKYPNPRLGERKIF
jgi:hypothetical protein